MQPETEQEEGPKIRAEFKCNDCESSYARVEHLERHVRTHLGAKFPCTQCSKEFTRSDVLKRHLKLHERGEGYSNPSQTRKEAAMQRTISACRSCAVSKVKCDGDGKSCGRCRTAGRECVYETPVAGGRSRLKRKRADPGDIDVRGVGSNNWDTDSPNESCELWDNLSSTPFVNPMMMLADVSSHPGSFSNFHPEDAGVLAGASSHDFSMNDLVDFDAPRGNQGGTSFNHLFDLPYSWGGLVGADEVDASATDPLGFQLDNHPSMFWSSFTSPTPLPPPGEHSQAPAVPSTVAHLGHSVPNIQPREDPRLDISAAGFATRHHSPEPGLPDLPSAWPLRWKPALTDSAVESTKLENASPTRMLEEHLALTPRFDEAARMAVLETLRFASLSDAEYHSLYRTLSTLSLSTCDLLVQYYFQHFNNTLMPFLHLPTFNPRRTSGLLLLVILGIGSLYSQLSGSTQFAVVLLEVSRRGIERLTNKDNRHARSLPMIQAMLLWSSIKWVGSPRTLELAEVYRGVFTTCLRRLRVFERSSPPTPPPSATLREQWHSFILFEERKRTGLACFALEMEMTSLLHLPPSIALSELNSALPCKEALWTAPSPEAWHSIVTGGNPQVYIPDVVGHLASQAVTLLPPSVALCPFGAYVLFRGLGVMSFILPQLKVAGFLDAEAAAAEHLRHSLRRLGQGLHDFSPRLGSQESEFSASSIAYHLAQISTHLSMEQLDTVAGRGTLSDAQLTRENLLSWMDRKRPEARTIALHAGQVVRLIKCYPMKATYEPLSLFAAALCLYLFACSLASRSTSMSVPSLRLDEYQGSAPTTWVLEGGSSILEGIGDLASPLAPQRILSLFSRQVEKLGAVWKIGVHLGGVLKGMAAKE